MKFLRFEYKGAIVIVYRSFFFRKNKRFWRRRESRLVAFFYGFRFLESKLCDKKSYSYSNDWSAVAIPETTEPVVDIERTYRVLPDATRSYLHGLLKVRSNMNTVYIASLVECLKKMGDIEDIYSLSSNIIEVTEQKIVNNEILLRLNITDGFSYYCSIINIHELKKHICTLFREK